LDFKFCSKQNNKIDLLYLIVAPLLIGGWQHNYSTKTRQAGRANEQSILLIIDIHFFETFSTPLLLKCLRFSFN
jgi:hypothetical protein